MPPSTGSQELDLHSFIIKIYHMQLQPQGLSHHPSEMPGRSWSQPPPGPSIPLGCSLFRQKMALESHSPLGFSLIFWGLPWVWRPVSSPCFIFFTVRIYWAINNPHVHMFFIALFSERSSRMDSLFCLFSPLFNTYFLDEWMNEQTDQDTADEHCSKFFLNVLRITCSKHLGGLSRHCKAGPGMKQPRAKKRH